MHLVDGYFLAISLGDEKISSHSGITLILTRMLTGETPTAHLPRAVNSRPPQNSRCNLISQDIGALVLTKLTACFFILRKYCHNKRSGVCAFFTWPIKAVHNETQLVMKDKSWTPTPKTY